MSDDALRLSDDILKHAAYIANERMRIAFVRNYQTAPTLFAERIKALSDFNRLYMEFAWSPFRPATDSSGLELDDINVQLLLADTEARDRVYRIGSDALMDAMMTKPELFLPDLIREAVTGRRTGA